MKKTKYLLSSATILMLAGGFFFGGISSCGTNTSSVGANPGVSPQKEEDRQQPECVRVVIDNSGSMKGYFNQADMKSMMQAIMDIGSLGKEEAQIQFFGDKKPFAGSHVASILAAAKFDKDTDLANLLSGCIALGGDSVPVALITDGIVSTPQGSNDLPQMEKRIRRILAEKNENLGWVIFRGETPYNGTYYVEAKSPVEYPKVKLVADERPFYIILIGPKSEVRYMLGEAEKKAKEWDNAWDGKWIALNVHDDHSSLEFYPQDYANFQEDSDGEFKYHNKDSKKMISLAFDYPSCLASRIKHLKPSNAVLEVNGDTVKGWKVTSGGSKTDGYVQIDIPREELEVNLTGDNILILSFGTIDYDEWTTKYNSSDDSSILTDTDEQERTYQLKSLIKPMSESSVHTDVKVKFSFKD